MTDVKRDPIDGRWYVEFNGNVEYADSKTEAIEKAEQITPKGDQVRVYVLEGGKHILEVTHDGLDTRSPYGEFGAFK